ncbi:GRIP and coiled-coil domain-containing protein 2-like isoform X5 [Periplaneta americana]|uniref:GRIP and coiled-coil domain-containing protein 2-like isoform X5 n=1 Tax=Periplaneta americana TaxID=6978 RepID=UPI0037E824A5
MDGAAKDADGIQKKGSLEALSKEELIEKCKSLLVIARRAKQAKDEAGEEVKKLKEQMNVLKAQNEEIKRGGKDCESNKKEREDQLQNELGAMQEMLGTLTEQKLQFTMEIDKLKKQNALLEKQLNQSKVEEVHIRSKVEELETAAESYKRQNHRLTNENEALIHQMETLEISMKEKDVQTAEKNSDKIAALEAELQLARDEVERLTEEDSRKKEQMKQLYATFNKDKTDLEKKLEAVLKQRGETISKLKELNSELEHKLRETNSKLESVQDELKKNILQLETKDKAICNLENELATLSEAQQKNMLIKNETIHSLEKEVMKFKECQHELETKTSALEAKEETIHNLEAKLIKQTERLHELSSKEQLIHSLKEELLTLKAVNKGKIKLDEANMSEDNSAKIKELEEEISVLKGRIQQLEHEAEEMRRESGDVHSEVMSSSTISKAEESARLKDLEETFEERYTKLRTVAVRLKKRVSELTVQQTQLENDKKKLASDKADLQAKVTQLSAHAKNLQTMQQEYDRLQDDLETQKSEVKELTKALEVSVNDCASLKVELQECQNEKESKIKELEICLKDKQKIDVANKELASHINSLKKEKEAENATRKEKEKEFKKLEEDLKASEKRLADEIDSHKNTQDLLEASRQECKKRSVLSLEMEDYEKSVADLTQQLAAEKSKVKELDNHLETQRDISRGLQEQILLLEQRIQSEEARTKEVKEQLNSSRTRLTEAEALALEREMSVAELASQIEQERDKNENFVLQLSELAAEKQRLVESARNQQDGLTRQVHALEEHVSHLKENLAEREAELADLRAEFGSYKVRAQSVLRQKARPDDGSSGFNREDYMEELAQLRQTSEVLRSKLQDASSKLQTLTVENNAVQEDRTRVLQRCQELVDTVQDLRNQNSQLQTQLQETAIEHREALRSQKLQAETLNQCYKQQLEELEERLQKETAALKKQLKETEERLHGARQQTSFVGEVSQSTEANVSVTTPTKQVTTAGPHWNNSTAGFFPVRSTSQQDPENKLEITLLEREEGEGSESVDSTSPHMTTSQEQRTELIPLDKLLSSPSEEDNNVPTVGASPSAELGRTKEQLVLSECRIKHLTGLLTEAERDLAKLTQQNQVLKEEIRRQQRSVEREQHAQNFEYLKNVVLKFVTLQGGDERSRLVPVLNTILKLSPEETNQLNIVAKAGGPDNQAGGRGWGSYLHLWPGTQ